jgi:two-component system, LytTR family, response regulator LytT
MKVVIIEDEPLVANDLSKHILNIDKKIEVMAILPSIEESILWFENNETPDLIFSDIQLTDGLSFEIFKTIACTTPVIFCTAYDEYALKAFKANGIDYILKPFTKKIIADALAKYKSFESNYSKNVFNYENIMKLTESQKNPSTSAVLVYSKDKIIPIQYNNIAIFYLENEVTYLLTFNGNKYSLNKSLEELEKNASNEFYRANRQCLVNRRAVKDASQYFARKLAISLNIPFNEEIIINKEKTVDFLNWLSGK